MICITDVCHKTKLLLPRERYRSQRHGIRSISLLYLYIRPSGDVFIWMRSFYNKQATTWKNIISYEEQFTSNYPFLYWFIIFYKITEILRTLWLVNRVAKPMFYCTDKPRFPIYGSFQARTRELETLAVTKLYNKQFRLSLTDINNITFRSTCTCKFARKNKTRSRSSYKAFNYLHSKTQQNFYADSDYALD